MVSDIVGENGRAILTAIIQGETDPERLVAVTNGRLRARHPTLVEALRGRIAAPHRFLLQLHVDQIRALEAGIAAVDQEVGGALASFRHGTDRLKTIPGVSDIVAHVIVSEIGLDMARFPTAGHLLSWAGLCPRNDESAGKRRSTRVRHGAPWLKTTLVQAAWAAARSKETYLHAQFLRLKSRRGPAKAIIAVAASILTAAYCMLRDGVEYRDLGGHYFEQRDKSKAALRLVRRLRDLGFAVELTAAT